MSDSSIDELCINTIRFLAVDAIQKANSGHPGAPLGATPMAYVLWDRFLKHNPEDAEWPDRDRFILSCGHASAMLYALLHLTGYNLSLDDLKQFRQWGSRTPGHPEYGVVPGLEVTTGPLGQGFANGVGMAIAERWLAANYNRPDHEIINHYTYAIVSDGDLEEGISSEAASIAGNLRLGKLIYLYDDNGISIEGRTNITFTEDISRRFQSCGWQVIGPVNGFDVDAMENALREAQSDSECPSLVICQTVIGYGSPNKAGKASAHGEPLGKDEVQLTRKQLGWDREGAFAVPPEVLKHLRKARDRGKKQQGKWQQKLEAYRQAYPDAARQLEEDIKGELPEGWDSDLDGLFDGESNPIATRSASGLVMNALAPRIRSLVGGSADLAPSTKTILSEGGDYSAADYRARNLHFGIREHAMGAIASGMARHGGVIPYTATFLVFYDYMRPPVRLAAMMGLRVIYIFTHDSVGVGEDGPTHQPIEQLVGLRSVPNLVTIRPADATETAEAWKAALKRVDGPTALVLSRQNLPVIDRRKLAPASGVQRGGYILQDAEKPEVIIMGTGSEVAIALEAGELLQEKGIRARIVSLPSWELFDAQPAEYRSTVFPESVKARISIEAGSPLGWERYVGDNGVIIGISHFGSSAPGKVLYEKLGLTAQRVADEAANLL